MKKLAIPLLAGLLYGAFDYYQLRSLSKTQAAEIIQLTLKNEGLTNVARHQADCILSQDTTIQLQSETIRLTKENIRIHERLEATIELRADILQETVDALMYGPKLRKIDIIPFPGWDPINRPDSTSQQYTYF